MIDAEGNLAPDLGLPDSAESGAPGWLGWIEPKTASGAVENRSFQRSGRPGERAGTLGPGERGRIAAYHGVPLVLHTFAFDDATSTGVVLPLMRDLVDANVDRGIGVVGVAHGTSDAALESELATLKQLGVAYPVARVDLTKAAGPYLDLAQNGLAFACVIGPNGALLWRGNPVEDERDFLAAVQAAYARTVVAPLERALATELDKATAAYLAAELKDARAKAEKLTSSKDAAVAADAALLVDLVERTRDEWLADAREHGASGPDLRYFEVVRALRTALARTDALDALDELEKEIKKKQFWRLRAQDLEGWIELRAERPAAFPARVDKAGDAFAKKLGKLGRSTFNSNEATQSAKELLERYAVAQARG
jgi:hypothetical protein